MLLQKNNDGGQQGKGVCLVVAVDLDSSAREAFVYARYEESFSRTQISCNDGSEELIKRLVILLSEICGH